MEVPDCPASAHALLLLSRIPVAAKGALLLFATRVTLAAWAGTAGHGGSRRAACGETVRRNPRVLFL